MSEAALPQVADPADGPSRGTRLDTIRQRIAAAPLGLRLALAAALFAVALWGRFALIGVLPASGFPFLTFFPAVLLAAWLAGLGPGLLVAAASVVAAWYWFVGTGGGFAGVTTADTVALVFFAAILAVDCGVIHLMNRSSDRARSADAGLRASERRLRQVLDRLFVDAAILDVDGRVRALNDAPLFRGGAPREALIGRPLWLTACWHTDPDGQARVRDAVARAAGGESVRLDLPMQRGTLPPGTLDLQVAPIDGDDGRPPTALVVCGVDVTGRMAALLERDRERSQAQTAAEVAEAGRRLLDAVLDAVPAGIIVADAEGRIVRMNRATTAIWGDAPATDTVAGYGAWKGWWADGGPRDGERLAAEDWGLARALRGEPCTDTVAVEPFGRPGERRMTLLSAAPVRDGAGQVMGAVVAQVDVTDRVRAEQALRDSEQRFRTMADHIPQLAWMGDARGRPTWYNRRWFDYTGVTPEAMAGPGWRAVHHPDEIDRVMRRFAAHVEACEAWEDTFPLRRHDGTFRWFLGRAVPVRDEAGRVVRWFGTHTDVTGQRETERALHEADRQKDTFLATLAHELRNPLAPIRSAAQVIRVRHGDDPSLVRLATVVERQAAQLARLVDDLLDVSRITFGDVGLRRERVDLRSVVADAVDACRPTIAAAGHAFALRLPPDPVTLDIDPARIAQSVSNLLDNACKFTPRGGHLSLDVARRGDDEVALTVRDDGQGIPADVLPRIFELFVQERRSGMGGHSGLGIGLALTRQLVQLHGGRVTAHSDGVGHGTRVEIVLPLAPGPAVDAGVAPADAPAAVVPTTLLVVDDNPDAVESLRLLLTLRGHTVHTAADGAGAIDACARHRPTVVLLDIGLPDLSGYEVARHIRARAPHPPVLVALTGWGQADDRARAAAAGFDHHLTKPADIGAIDAIVDAAARAHRSA